MKGMNKYTVIKAFRDVDNTMNQVGEVIFATPERGVKLMKNKLVALLEEYTEKLVQTRYRDGKLELFNSLTGEVISVVDTNGIDDVNEVKAAFANKVDSSNYIDIRWLGATKDTDSHDIIMQIHNSGLGIKLPKGIWRSSPLNFTTPPRIIGENGNYIYKYTNSVEASVLAPFGDQTHIINIDLLDPVDNTAQDQFELSNFVISCMSSSSGSLTYAVDYCCNITNACYGKVDIVFSLCSGRPFKLSGSWEIDFERLYFREINSIEPCMTFETSTNNRGISQCMFKDLQFEAFSGLAIKCVPGCNFYHCKINSIMIESSISTYQTEIAPDVSYTDVPYFDISSMWTVAIGDILINCMNEKSFSYGGINYTRQTIFKCINTGVWLDVHVSNIKVDTACGHNVRIAQFQTETTPSGLQSFIIDTATCQGDGINFYSTIAGFRTFVIKYKEYKPVMANAVNKSITEWYSPGRYTKSVLYSNSYYEGNNENCFVLPTPEVVNDEITCIRLNAGQTATIVYSGVTGGAATIIAEPYTILGALIPGKTQTQALTVVLTDAMQEYTLTNDTLLPALYTIKGRSRTGQFRIYDIS